MNFISSFIYCRIAHRPNLIKIVHNISWLFFDKILKMGLGFFVGVWIVRYLGPEQFGLLSFATAFVGLFGAFATLGFQDIVVRDIVRNPNRAPETLGTTAILQLIGGIAAYLIILVAIVYLRPDDSIARTIVAIIGPMILLKVSEIAVWWFESKVLSKYTVWAQNGVFLVFAAVKVILILEHASLIAFVWIMLAEAVVVTIVLLGFMNKYGLLLTKLRFSTKRAKSLLKDSWPLLLSSISITIYMKIDQIMLGYMIGDKVVGIYSAALRISEFYYFIPIMVMASTFPTIIKSKKRSEKQYYSRLQKLYDLMVVISVGLALPTAFLSTYIVALFFGEAYRDAGIILAIHIWAAVFVFFGAVNGKWFLIENLTRLIFIRSIFGCLLNIFLNFILIPIFSAPGAALGTFLSAFFVNFLVNSTNIKTKKIFLLQLRALNIIGIYLRNYKTQ
jgi:O-antigen/teichoic acid export membrane protein